MTSSQAKSITILGGAVWCAGPQINALRARIIAKTFTVMNPSKVDPLGAKLVLIIVQPRLASDANSE